MVASTEATASAISMHSQERAHTCGLPRERQSSGVLQELYACASPMVVGKVEGKLRVKMLIDSGSEMNVMSKGLWERAQDLLPIDIVVNWSIGSANCTHDRVYGTCHAVAVDIGGVEITVPVFILEGASQQFILGRPWERLAQAQYNNQDDRSLYISIKSIDNKRRAIFCAVAEHSEWNRDRIRIMRLELLVAILGIAHCQVIYGDAPLKFYMRFTNGKESLAWEEEELNREVVIGAGM